MPLHSAMVGSELHQDKLISTALTSDAGKVTTPSSVTPGVGVLRKLKGIELETDLVAATDRGKALVQSTSTDDVPEWRYITPADVNAYLSTVGIDLADISVASTDYRVAAQGVEAILIRVVLYGALTLVNETITVTVGAAAAVPLTVPFAGSGAGVRSASVLTNLSAAQVAGSLITVTSAGNSTGPARAHVSVELYQ